jgi:hypothetical protein
LQVDGHGIYRISGKVKLGSSAEGSSVRRTKSVSIFPKEWLVKPRGFTSILMEGTLSDDGELIYGVVPVCNNGPFSITKDVVDHDGTVGGLLEDVGLDQEASERDFCVYL